MFNASTYSRVVLTSHPIVGFVFGLCQSVCVGHALCMHTLSYYLLSFNAFRCLLRFLNTCSNQVLDAHAYEARQKEYAVKGHRHFYFMTLNTSEVCILLT